jgi:FtsP/CotA-like multicopper oxidase with cupredoxin domain
VPSAIIDGRSRQPSGGTAAAATHLVRTGGMMLAPAAIYHCHDADHEDKGMMVIVEVVSSQSTINPQEAGHAGHGHH